MIPEGPVFSKFAEFLAKQIIDRASGKVLPSTPDTANGLLLRRPADIFFIGSLGPEAAFGDRNTAPPAMGLEFFVKNLGQITVSGSFRFFRSERPNYDLCVTASGETDDPQFDLPVPLRQHDGWFSVEIELEEGTRDVNIQVPDDGLHQSFGAPNQSNNYRFAKKDLAKEQDFQKALLAVPWVAHDLTLAASIIVDVSTDILRGYRIQIRLVNKSVNPRWATAPKTVRRVDRYEEPFLFDVNLAVELRGSEVEPTILDLDASDFRYDNRLWAEGFNCAAEFNPELNRIRTRYAPIARQRRMRHASGKEDLRFAAIAADPLPKLKELLNEMIAYKDKWASSQLADDEERKAENADRARFHEEVDRFTAGISCLENDEHARLAFTATMQTFAKLWQTRDPAAFWRRFQLVFVVSVIGGLYGRTTGNLLDLKVVDILWFPTGGGKTEAYLALMIWHAFFDRLRGKTAGVTAMMRFPLRLLSLQQMQRVIEAVACAEQIRKTNQSFKGEGFTVGFLVGSTATKNKLSNDDIRQLREQLQLPFEKRYEWVKRHRVVAECPSCHRRSVDIRVDPGDRLVHYCTNKKCNVVLPLIIIDDEVYRFLPTVLVGTIDKLALIGQNVRWRQLLGYIDGFCSVHGYCSGGKCPVYQCSGSVRKVALVDPGPALEVQDELHLLREDLGVVASHYETVAHAIVEKYSIAPMKVVASTATIQDHERQAAALYCRDSRQFPALGPDLQSSFYVDTENYDQRLFIGIMPRRLTHINALMQLMQIEHGLLQGLRNRDVSQSIVEHSQLDAILDYYEVVITYTLRRIDQDRVDGSINSQLNPYLVRRKLRPVQNQPMTANTTTEEVTAILDELENPDADIKKRMTSFTATSMISHGVDVNRLNIMNFFGMPFSTAEYIQTSSRVGRFVCGCVFIVYQAHKERERSHYQRFLKYHDYQNRLVEPIPLNRWATRGLHFTAPGLVMAAIFALFGNRWTGANRKSLWLAKEVLKAFDQRIFSVQETAAALVDALHVEAADKIAVQEQLESLIRDALEQARIADSKKGFGGCMIPEPMQSLRDVEDTFYVDVLGPNMWFVESV
jgi:hypothetical protein